MAKTAPAYIWQSQRMAKDCETIECPEHDAIKDFKRDPTGIYVLIKVNFDKVRIEVAVCSKDHEILKIFSGRKSQDVYDTFFKYEKKHNLKWFHEKTHIAYLGKELKKAEIALSTGSSAYFQE